MPLQKKIKALIDPRDNPDDFGGVTPTNILSYYVMSAQPLGITWHDFLNTELKTMLSLITLSQVYKAYQYSEQQQEQKLKDNRK